MIKVVIRNIIYTILLPMVALFFGLVLSFLITFYFPGDPVLVYLPKNFTAEQYNAMVHVLGFDQPLLIQFFMYLTQLFTGNLGISSSIASGMPIIQLLLERIPATIEFTILPIVLGLIAGILIGILSVRVRSRVIKLLIQILIIFGISMPVFFGGMWAQYTFGFQLELFPVVGDPFLPSCILFLLTLFLTTRQVRSNYLKKSEEKHILSNSLQLIFNLSILLVSCFLLEVVFNLHGFFELLIVATFYFDYWLFRACAFILIALPVFILFLSNIVYTIYHYFLEESQSEIFTKYFGRTEQVVEESVRYTVDSDQKFKDFIYYRLKSPLTIIGLAIVVFTIIVAIFPQVLTPLTLEQATGIYPGSWDPPSDAHPFGQTKFGRDVLGLLAYGISTSIKVCTLSVLIGITIGLLFGYLSKVHRWVKELVLGIMVVLFIIPSVIVIIMYLGILGGNIETIIGIMAMYVVPGVTLLISKGNYSLKLTAKKILTYFPLILAFNIMVFEALGFLGFSDLMLVQLGSVISEARLHLFDAPWAFFLPGLVLYASVIGLFTLHYGLKEPIPIVRRS